MPRNNINSIHYEDLDKNKDPNGEDADDDKYRKIGSVRRLFKKSNRDYYKPTVINRGFAGDVNNYIKYRSEGDKDEKLSPEEYLNMIRVDLRDLINRPKPIEELIIKIIVIIIIIIPIIIVVIIMIPIIMILIVENGKFSYQS